MENLNQFEGKKVKATIKLCTGRERIITGRFGLHDNGRSVIIGRSCMNGNDLLQPKHIISISKA